MIVLWRNLKIISKNVFQALIKYLILKDFLNSIKTDINEEVGKKLGLLKVKDNLINYDSENDNLYIHHITHTHLHRPEISENTKKIIDEIYASCLNYSKLKFK